MGRGFEYHQFRSNTLQIRCFIVLATKKTSQIGAREIFVPGIRAKTTLNFSNLSECFWGDEKKDSNIAKGKKPFLRGKMVFTENPKFQKKTQKRSKGQSQASLGCFFFDIMHIYLDQEKLSPSFGVANKGPPPACRMIVNHTDHTYGCPILRANFIFKVV